MNTLAVCKDRLLSKRNSSINAADTRTEELRKCIPALTSIDAELSSIPLKLITAAKRDDYADIAEKLRSHMEELRSKRARLLNEAGYPADYDSPHFECEKCCDRGYIGYNMCDCLKKMIAEESYIRSGLGCSLAECTFDNFQTYYYPSDTSGGEKSPRDIMESVKARCQKFADEFGKNSASLLFMGGTGLGKTHISAAIGGTVIKKGMTVIYESARNILNEYRENTFSDGSHDLERFFSCNLLIIDDLGAEPKSEFAAAAFTDIVDRRLLAGKSTIISTNLTASEMVKGYSQRFVSRVLGCYTLMTFVGKDIRMLKMTGKK